MDMLKAALYNELRETVKVWEAAQLRPTSKTQLEKLRRKIHNLLDKLDLIDRAEQGASAASGLK